MVPALLATGAYVVIMGTHMQRRWATWSAHLSMSVLALGSTFYMVHRWSEYELERMHYRKIENGRK